jgi:ketosteroid isomerase-like protein
MTDRSGQEVAAALIAAVNAHDLDAIVDQFSGRVRSETPAHPARSFKGSEQVRRNWTQILGAVSDLRAEVRSSTTSTDSASGRETVWLELAFDGRRPDGAPWRIRGVTVNEVADGRIDALRFYMEPLETAGPGADDAVRRITTEAVPAVGAVGADSAAAGAAATTPPVTAGTSR